MFWLLVALLLILLVAAAVVVYVAYPHRGEEVPGAPWLGEAMKRGIEALPAPLEPPLEAEHASAQEFALGLVHQAEDDSTRV